MRDDRMTSADAIEKEILTELAKGLKVETTDRYDAIVNVIVENAKEMRQENSYKWEKQ